MGGSINTPLSRLSSGIHISHSQWLEMKDAVASSAPEEACGLVAGNGNQAQLVFPITNILHDRYRFRMAPDEQLDAFIQAEAEGLEIIAIYHSHPHGIDHPSATDVAELTFPGIVYLIWYQVGGQWQCCAYLMHAEKEAIEVPVIISTNL
jgi:proteasome lid subunit RPN8/RPN11